jgi:glutamate carboxypeptidase
MPLERRDGRLHGPGVYDMKAGIALGMLAVRAWLARAPADRRVVMLFTSDEETGSHTSRALIEEEALRSRAALVLEPSLARGGVKTFRKGVGEFEVDVEGISAHAGIEPGRGASAIHELFAHLAAFRALEDPEHGLSVNVGVVEGGTRGNVVAERARAVVDIRVSRLEDGARVERAVRAMRPRDPRTRVSIRGGVNRPPLERTEGVGRLYAIARGIAAELGFDLPEGGTGGASDGNFTGALGVPTLDGLGAVGAGAHALEEYVDVTSLPLRAALVAGLLSRV